MRIPCSAVAAAAAAASMAATAAAAEVDELHWGAVLIKLCCAMAAATETPAAAATAAAAAACVVPERCSRGPEMFRTFWTFRTFRTCRTMFRTKIAILGFSATRQTALPIRIVPRFCAGGCGRFQKLPYGPQVMVVETHDAVVIRTMTSSVAAMYLAAGAFFSVKMTTQDLTSPVADIYLAAGA